MVSRAYTSVGRRKRSIAVATLKDQANGGDILINGMAIATYFPRATLVDHVLAPLKVGEEKYAEGEISVSITVKGGGMSGQAGAARLAIARVLCNVDPTLRPALRKGGYLTRDPREKERKKYGLKRARKAPQFSKR